MAFNKLSLISILIFSFINVGCGDGGDNKYSNGNYVIGNSLSEVSTLASRFGEDSKKAAIFDRTTRKIHVFDAESFVHEVAYSVTNPQDDHYVLYSDEGNYIVNLSSKQLTVFDENGNAQHDPIKFAGTPVSAAFRPDLGSLVVYDDLQSVGMLKLEANGRVSGAWVGGAVFDESDTILSGDISDGNKLILAISDGSLRVVDIEKSIVEKKWESQKLAIGVTDIKWISAVPGQANQILMRSNDEIILFDYIANTTLSNINFTDDDFIALKYSREKTPHVILKHKSQPLFKIVYADNGVLNSKRLLPPKGSIMISMLDKEVDSLNLVMVDFEYSANAYNDVRESRRLLQYRFSDMLAINEKAVPNNAEIQITNKYIFSLFPSELGYVTRSDIADSSFKEIKGFNLKYIE